MNIKISHRPSPLLLALKRFRKHQSIQNTWLKALVFLLYTALIAVVTISLIHFRLLDTGALMTSISKTPEVLLKKGQGMLMGQPEQLVINIKHEDFQRLAFKREQALALGQLVTDEDDFVPATIDHQGRQIKAKLRLKGDVVDHLETEKWSFRIKIKGEDAYEGLKIFSIQHPNTRNFVAEWLYHTALKREGVLSLRYRFVDVVINGKAMGIFALEEHFSKELIEYNQRREGPILKFVEDLVWERWEAYETFQHAVPLSDAAFTSSLVDPFQFSKVSADSLQYQHFLNARSLIENFRAKKLSTSAVFDAPLLARYMAVSELVGAQHGARWGNIRFYYNPITNRLEPIGYDGFAGEPVVDPWVTLPAKQSVYSYDQLQVHLLEDPAFFAMYIQALERVSSDDYLDQLLTDVEEALGKHLKILYREYPEYALDLDVLQRNQDLMKYVLYPAEGLRAHALHWNADSLLIELGATQALPLVMEGIIWNDSTRTSLADQPFISGKKEAQAMVFEAVDVVVPAGVSLTDSTLTQVEIAYRVSGSDSLRTTSLVPYQGSGGVAVQHDLVRRPANLEAFSFVDVEHEARTVRIAKGYWIVTEPLIMPEGYTLEMGAGTTVDLIQESLILSRGALSFKGTANNPIRIFSSDTTGQGLVVLNAEAPSSLEHVVFDNLHSVNRPDWVLTGAVTFYDTEASFKHTQFLNSKSEDALNLVRTSFVMEDVLFEASASDAFDADFCEGTVRNTTFLNPFNDGIDVSGSKVLLESVVVKQAGDKAISAGEHSTILGTDVQMLESEIAIASKDLSRIKLKNSLVSDTRVGLAIFQKKPEYGPGAAEMDGLEMREVMTPVLLEEGSYLYLNGKKHEATNPNVYEMLYGNVFGRASK